MERRSADGDLMDRLPARTLTRRRRATLAVAVAAGVVAASSCLVLAAVGDHGGALVLASWSTGFLGLVSGAATLFLGREPGGLPRFRAAGGVAGLFYGVGMTVNAVERQGGSTVFVSVGDLVSLGGIPFVIFLIAALPRPTGRVACPTRLLADAAVVAGAGALVLWQLVLQPPGDGLGPVSAATLVVLALELFCLGYLLGLAVLGHDRCLVLLLLGGTALVAGNLLKVQVALTGGGAAVWAPATVMCVGAPLLCGGALLVRARPGLLTTAPGEAAEARTSLSTVLVLGFGAAAVLSTTLGRVDDVSRGLLVILVVAVLLREVVVQRQRMRDAQALRHLAEHDALTGAGNRRALERALRERGDEPRLVVVLDLDGFTSVNDRYGPGLGDALLCAVARSLSSVEEGRAQVFRLGADDFAVLVTADPARAAVLAGRACTLVAEAAAAMSGTGGLRLSAHAGVDRVAPRAGEAGEAGEASEDAWLPVTRATQALVAAQRSNGAAAMVWGEALVVAERRRSSLEERLRASLAEDSLEIHLQPVVELATGRLLGFEALSRWHDAVLGRVHPDEFVPVAEESGLVVELGTSVLDASLAALVRCDGVARGLTMAVNASPVELRGARYVERLAGALAEHGVPADLLVVEVTEAVMIVPGDPAVASLHALAEMGVRVAVDDFGTGFSSLAYLTRLPVHVLKIDRSLTVSLDDRGASAVVQAAAAMAEGMGLEVIAEGVEDASQLVALAGMGIGSGQGWLWSPALPEAEAMDLVLRGRALGPSSDDASRTRGSTSLVSDVAGS